MKKYTALVLLAGATFGIGRHYSNLWRIEEEKEVQKDRAERNSARMCHLKEVTYLDCKKLNKDCTKALLDAKDCRKYWGVSKYSTKIEE